tara:strand:- start:603 stop:1076 length:474 start_codon:yes stop_codon:yes gene_type:complete
MLEADRARLVKFLGMSQSDFDGEALSAVRKANELIKKLNVTWDDVMAVNKPASSHESFWDNRANYEYSPQEKAYSTTGWNDDDTDYDELFDYIYEHNKPSGKWEEIIGSIKSQWFSNERLSEKQGNLIKKFYKTAQENVGKAEKRKPSEHYSGHDEW